MSNDTKLYSLSGQPIYKHENQKEFEIADMSDSSVERIEEHFEKNFGKVKNVFHEIISDKVHIDVHVIEPSEEQNYYIIFTTGMSDKPMNVPDGREEYQYCEIYMFLPKEWKMSQENMNDDKNYWPIGNLKSLARMPHQYDTWLAVGHTVANGDPAEPYAENTKLCCSMLTYPIMGKEGFDKLKIREDKVINFYYVFPLFKEEMDFKLKKGMDELLDKFDNKKIGPVLNIKRKNAVKWF